MGSQRAAIASRIFRFLFFVTDALGAGNHLMDKDFAVKSSIILRVYSLLVLAAISYHFFGNLNRVRSLYTGNSTTSLLYFEYVIYWLGSLSCIAASIWKQNRIRDWIQNSRQVFLNLTEDKLIKLHLICVTIISGCFVMLGLFTVISYFGHVQPNLSAFSLFMVAATYGNTLLIIVQFIMGVLFISHLFRDLNNELSESLGNQTKTSDQVNLFTLEYAHYFRKDATSPEVSRIRKLSERHDKYASLAKDLNQCFSPQLFFFTGLCFVELTYSIFCFAMNDDVAPSQKRFSVVFLSDWFVTYAMLLVGFTVSSQILINEANKSGPLAHKIINSERRRLVKHALELFSLQVYQTDLEITALGLFAVKNSLLYEMVGGITSALIILIQFQKYSSPELEGSMLGLYNTSTINRTGFAPESAFG